MRSLFVCATIAGAAAQTTANLVFQQNLSTAVYTSAALSRHATSDLLTFGAGTWLNPPIGIEVYNVTSSGTLEFTYTVADKSSVFQMDSARHNIGDTVDAGAVDMFAAESLFSGPGVCTVNAFISAKQSSSPAWNFSLNNCQDYLLYDQTRMLDASDDGTTVAFAAYVTQDGNATARLYVFEGQTGATRFVFNLGPTVPIGSGGVATSESGAWIVYCNSPNVYIIDGKSGAVRATLPLYWGGVAPSISDTGDYVVLPDQDSMLIFLWNAAKSTYVLTDTVVPSGPTQWYPMDLSVATIAGGAQYACMGWIIGSSMQARVTIYSLADGTMVSDYTSPVNTNLQTSATVRMDQNYCGVALWGDSGTGDNVPTSVLLQAGTDTPVFTYVTPGSNFGLDVLLAKTVGANDIVYLAVSGKATPANEVGNGGDAFVWEITTPSQAA